MLKHILYSLFFLIFHTVVKSQSITISEEINIRNDNGYEILGRFKGNILLFRDRLAESEIVAFDDQMRQKWQKKIEYEERRPQVLDAIGGKDYFSIVYRGKTKNGTLVKVSRFDANANFIDSITAINYGNRLSGVAPSCVYSEDKKIVLIYNYEQNERIEATTVDLDNMKVLWSQTVTLTESMKHAASEQVIVTNDGTAYFIYEKESGSSLFSSEPAQFIIHKMNHITNDNSRFLLEDIISYSVQFAYNNLQKELSAIAAISERNKSKVTAILWIKDIGTSKTKQYSHHLSDETVFAISGKKNTNNKGLSDLKVQEIAFRKDGGVVTVLEEVRQFARSMNTVSRPFGVNDVASGRMTYDYYNEALIATSFNPDGTQQWEKVMAKKQFSQDDDGVFASYGLLKVPSALRLIFNDEIKTETTTSEYVLTGDGIINRHSMFNTAQQNIMLRFRDALQIGSEEFIIPSELRTHLKLVKIKY
jgi:hypothetical protein